MFLRLPLLLLLRLPLLLESQANPTSSQRRTMAIFHLLETTSQLIRVASTRKMNSTTLQPLTCFLISSIVYRKFVYFSFLTFANSISSPSGWTALNFSAANGHLEVCELLVSSKCDVNSSDREYAHTPNLFFEMFYQKCVLFSFPTFRNSISSPSGYTALILSVGHLEVCKLLVSSKCDVNSSSRMYAHTPNFFLKCFTENLFCFHFQLFVTPSLLPAVSLH